MLVLAIALQTVSLMAVTPPPVVRTASARKPAAKGRAVRRMTTVQQPVRYRTRLLDGDCISACAGDTSLRYRVASYANVEDHKMRAISGRILPCETSGAPKCPARGRQLLWAPISND
jgi:hypothetical protein